MTLVDHGMIRLESRSRTRSAMSAMPDSTFADPKDRLIADLQRQLAASDAKRDEALAERDKALAQQAATAEVLQVINRSPGDLAPVFEAILEKALRLCEADFGGLITWDGQRMHRVAARGLSAELMEALHWKEPQTPQPGSVADRLIRGEDVISIADLAEEGLRKSPHVQTLARVSGARSYLALALRRDERLLGIIAIHRNEVWPFTDKQIALLQNFAAQAVIAMENARLITETREALEQQTATAEVLQVINSSPGDLAPVFDAMLEKAMHLCGAAFGELHTYDGERFAPAVVRGVPEAHANFRRHHPTKPSPGTIPERIVQGAEVLHIADLMAEEVYRAGDPERRALVDLGGARTALAVALRKDGSLLGLLLIYRQELRPFSDKQVALFQNFAAQAVIAMENARLLGELRQRADEVAELNRGLEARVAEQVEELGRVGRLKRFLAPQLAEMIVSQGDENILESHRREIVVVFCDLRGYTAFTETAEPEEVLEFLRQYHRALGPLVSQFEGPPHHG